MAKGKRVLSDIFETLFRVLKFQLFYNLFFFRHRSRVEIPKRVMRNFRWKILLLLPVHLIPLGVTLAMILLNTVGIYIGAELAGPSGDYDAVKLGAIQFAAKIHELFMQGSLSVAVIDIVRRELVSGEGVPFGALCAALGHDLTWLYSKELWGSVKAKYQRPIRKVRLILLIVVGIALSNTVGPSTAILMRPQSGTWPVGGTCKTVGIAHRSGCPSDGWGVIGDNYLSFWSSTNVTSSMIDKWYLGSHAALRLAGPGQRSGFYRQKGSVTRLPMANLAEPLGNVATHWLRAASTRNSRFQYREDVVFGIKNATQPIVEVLCHANGYETKDDYDRILVPGPGSRCSGNGHTWSLRSYRESDVMEQIWKRHSDDNITSPTLQFVDFSEAGNQRLRNASLGVFITLPASSATGKKVLGCSVDARWSNSTMTSSIKTNIRTVSNDEPPDFNDYGICAGHDGLKKIHISPGWANYLNPTLRNMSSDVFQHLAIAASLDPIWNYEEVPGNQSEWYKVNNEEWDTVIIAPYFEALLASLIANGLSLNYATATLQGYTKDDSVSRLLPRHSFGHRYDTIYQLPPGTNTSTMSEYKVHVDIEGYAYILSGTAVILSTIILSLYVVFVLGYIALLWTFRQYSTSWDSMSELTALAVQSPETSVLKNTTAGIYTSSIYSNKVQVVKRRCQNGDLKLALHFSDGGDSPKESEKVVTGEYYH
ncbi:hypothetical protein FE257_010824 [Aspergillus nanangensis]|uniref:Uncharacterized protein n=1 Tax=Aspergillus nanangensis TaxID=2582783 RepID=A0AAD4CW21_ASPNN|nr:hypothetical protein FE257_010824 [Aspergillus nanangensis]